jgi:hypothetical protein
MRKPVFPIGLLLRKRDQGAFVTAASFPFILSHVGNDAIEVGAKQGFAAKGGKGTVEAYKNLLGKIFDVFAAAGKPNQRAEDHDLVVSDDLLEAGVVGQAESDCESR